MSLILSEIFERRWVRKHSNLILKGQSVKFTGWLEKLIKLQFPQVEFLFANPFFNLFIFYSADSFVDIHIDYFGVIYRAT